MLFRLGKTARACIARIFRHVDPHHFNIAFMFAGAPRLRFARAQRARRRLRHRGRAVSVPHIDAALAGRFSPRARLPTSCSSTSSLATAQPRRREELYGGARRHRLEHLAREAVRLIPRVSDRMAYEFKLSAPTRASTIPPRVDKYVDAAEIVASRAVRLRPDDLDRATSAASSRFRDERHIVDKFEEPGPTRRSSSSGARSARTSVRRVARLERFSSSNRWPRAPPSLCKSRGRRSRPQQSSTPESSANVCSSRCVT